MSDTAEVNIHLRARARDRDLIDQAAAISGSNRTRFILDASRQAAEQVLADQVRLTVDPAQYRAFIERLDAGPAPNERLRKSLNTPAPWDEA
jgi:uncharacterized protein (DUF1778 family)